MLNSIWTDERQHRHTPPSLPPNLTHHLKRCKPRLAIAGMANASKAKKARREGKQDQDQSKKSKEQQSAARNRKKGKETRQSGQGSLTKRKKARGGRHGYTGRYRISEIVRDKKRLGAGQSPYPKLYTQKPEPRKCRLRRDIRHMTDRSIPP